MSNTENIEYAGFWIRTLAALIDSAFVMMITTPALLAIYGMSFINSEKIVNGAWNIIISWIFPALAVILFWLYKSATPGKMITKIKIVDAKTGNKPNKGQCIGRYFAYYVSVIPLLLGIFWVGLDKRKQGWHDKIAGTLVIKTQNLKH